MSGSVYADRLVEKQIAASNEEAIGPRLSEFVGERWTDIICGVRGQNAFKLPVEEVEAAQGRGHQIIALKPFPTVEMAPQYSPTR